MKLAIMGPPGSGKGTQSVRLSKKLGIPHISTGDLLRKAVKEETPLGLSAKKFIEQGKLVSDDIVSGLVRDRILEPDCQGGFILDGFPRTIPQAKLLDQLVSAEDLDGKTENSELLDIVIMFDISESECVNRLANRKTCSKCGLTFNPITNPPKKSGLCDKCGSALILRKDDKPETVSERFKVYYKSTEPMVNYYDKLGRLVRVDASPSPDQVFESTLEFVKTASTI